MINAIKDPGAVLDYTFDWAPWLGTDTILTSTWSVPPGMTLVSQSNTTTTATAFVSGGRADDQAIITNTIITVGGRTDDRSIVLSIQQR